MFMYENFNPFRVEPGKVPPAVAARNMIFDPVFYDVLSLSADERAEIVRASANAEYHEGGMLLVWPAKAGKGIEYHAFSRELCEAYPDLSAVAVPGVGSSPMGAAAFARQVADVTGKPVVGVIAGYGLADVMSEALGGWFDFGMRNRLQSAVRLWRETFAPVAEKAPEQLRQDWGLASSTGVVDKPDVNTVLNLMLRLGTGLELLAAHSKGSMVVQCACDAFESENELGSDTYDHVHVVTFGCGVSLPPSFTQVSQFVGTWDVLGGLNTPLTMRNDPSLTWVEEKAHNLVELNPFHMPVESALPEALGVPKPRGRAPAKRKAKTTRSRSRST